MFSMASNNGLSGENCSPYYLRPASAICPKILTTAGSMREYFICMTCSQHRGIYEALAIYLILTFVILAFLFFTIVVVLSKKTLGAKKNNVKQSMRMVNINEIENGNVRSRRV